MWPRYEAVDGDMLVGCGAHKLAFARCTEARRAWL